MKNNISKFRNKLKDGNICIAASVTMIEPLITEALADSVDLIWIDLEHSNMSPEVLSGHLLASRAKGVPAIVRLTGSDTSLIKPVLDLGAEGIVVPQVRSAEEVKKIVDDCHYPPIGRRGYGPRVPSNYGREPIKEYINSANENIFISVMIENIESFEALDDILKIKGLDSIVIGPMDLSGSMGVLGEIENPKVVKAIETIISKAQKAGVFVGMGLGTDTGQAARMIKSGIQWVQLGCDYRYLIEFIDQSISLIKDKLGE